MSDIHRFAPPSPHKKSYTEYSIKQTLPHGRQVSYARARPTHFYPTRHDPKQQRLPSVRTARTLSANRENCPTVCRGYEKPPSC